jgi:alkanesulfonate monooxygenase SsuD/methylene tetrahydromethanopterin reductase-like flavin-dependent oxidoreductase (luciferase family)
MTPKHPVRFGIVVAQRGTWPELAARAREVEDLGFDVLNVVDHFYGGFDVTDPCHEAYTILAGMATVTNRVRLGVMVGGNTYRNPAFHLKQAVAVDHLSNGRVEFGVGAGWLEREHEAYSFPFPSAGDRVSQFAEALEIWELLQRNERTTYEGRYYQLIDAPFEPKPIQDRLPFVIGGSKPRMMKLAAKYADIWNAIGTPVDLKTANADFDTVCATVGRDPASVMRSVCPRLDMWTSLDAFAQHITDYRNVGFTDFQIPWPRTPEQHQVLRQVGQTLLPKLRER